MARIRNNVPTPRNLRGSTVIDAWRGNQRVQITLGPWQGCSMSREAKAEYAKFVAEYTAGGFDQPNADATVNEVMAAFLRHALVHYRLPEGGHSSEVTEYKRISAIIREVYGDHLAREFGPRKLETVRNLMLAKHWCRTRINRQIGRLKRIFKWATAKEIVPASVLHSLQAVTGLQRGRTIAHETDPVKPVSDETVKATLPFLTRTVAGMVRLQALTGARPGEICSLRWSEIDSSKEIWIYRPNIHKLAYRGDYRTIPLGPRAQLLLQQFPTERPVDFIFSPARSMEETFASRSAARQTPRFASHMQRNAAKRVNEPKRTAGEKYTSTSYNRAVAKAVIRANERRLKLCGTGNFDPVPGWHVNQLRHAAATRLRALHGIEAASTLLGHKRLATTEIYAAKHFEQAVAIATELG